MNITLDVHYTDASGYPINDDEISRAYIVSATDKAVIIHLETKSKYPEASCYTATGCNFKTQKGNVAWVRIKGIPYDTHVIAEANRYSMYIVLFHDPEKDAQELIVPSSN